MSAPPAEPVTPDPPAGRVRPQVMTQAWTRLTYCHWAYDPADVARVLPPGLRPDVDDEHPTGNHRAVQDVTTGTDPT